MKNERLSYLFNGYVAQTLNEEELQEFYYLVATSNGDKALCDLVDGYYLQSGISPLTIINEAAVLKNVLAAAKTPKVVKLTSRLKWLAAASIILVLGFGIGIYRNYLDDNNNLLAAKLILPAQDVAKLTLANGAVILLDTISKGALIRNGGIEIAKTASGEVVYKVLGNGHAANTNVIETPKGGKYKIWLPDGTAVWLNAGTKLKFPSVFSGAQRTVYLEGEAYFEVAKLKNKTFIVNSGVQFVEVLGTHFNLKAYANSAVTTTLLEGSVRTGNATNSAILKPGQQAVLQYNGAVQVALTDLESTMAWKNGEFVFKDQALDEVMAEVGRWYAVEVEIASNVNAQQTKLVGWVSREKDLSAVIKNIATATGLTLKVEGRKILISK